MTICGEWSFVKRTGDEVSATPLLCKSWGCDECGPRRKAQLIAKAFAGKPSNFLTLTCSTKAFPDPIKGAEALSSAWRLIVKRAKREAARDITKTPYPHGPKAAWMGKEDSKGRVPRQVTLLNARLPYLAVFEATKNGAPHLHIIARVPWLGQNWLSIQMDEIMSSPICWIERVANDGRIAYYISKYVGKQSERFGNCKRYWSTLNWEKPNGDETAYCRDEGAIFSVERRHIDDVVDDWILYKFEPFFKRGTWYRGENHYHGPDPPSAAQGHERDQREKSIYYGF